MVPNDYPEPVAEDWPDLLRIVETKVKPERAQKAAEVRNFPWWRYWRLRAEFGAATQCLSRIIAISRVTQQVAFTYVPVGIVFADSIALITDERYATFCLLQSNIHEIWTRFFASSLEERLRYTPSDCFETFPFPGENARNKSLEASGYGYYSYRAALMVKNNEGMTKIYNRFHDPEERSPDILRLRELHAAMDRAVLDAYGWTEIQPTYEFLLDYEDEEDEEEETGRARRRKKPWRYRWPDEIRDEVLAKLLDLNRQRAEEEKLAGLSAEGKPRKGSGRRGRQLEATSPAQGGEFFGGKLEERL